MGSAHAMTAPSRRPRGSSPLFPLLSRQPKRTLLPKILLILLQATRQETSKKKRDLDPVSVDQILVVASLGTSR